jgi:hypothetical protein
MSRATTDLMDALHGLLTTTMIDQLTAHAGAVDADGVAIPIPPAFLAQCLKLLKDNGIDSPARAQKMLDVLNDTMPEFDDPTHEARH